jgi:hypothetical protein
MTYKEYYLTLNSPEDIMTMANADMALACVINPDRMEIIRQSAEEALREKFGEEVEVIE